MTSLMVQRAHNAGARSFDHDHSDAAYAFVADVVDAIDYGWFNQSEILGAHPGRTVSELDAVRVAVTDVLDGV